MYLINANSTQHIAMQRSTSQIQRKFYAVHLTCIKTIDVLYTWTYTPFPLICQKNVDMKDAQR